MQKFWKCGRFELNCTNHCYVMGIVNVTPDSFSDGGAHNHLQAALVHAQKLMNEGAEILDIGGESTRPDSQGVSIEEEWLRVAPLLRALKNCPVPISLDTRHTEIMRRALAEDLIDAVNDVFALQDEGALELLSEYPKIGICLMHMQNLPENMQNNPHYDDVCDEVKRFLAERINACVAVNIDKSRLLLDPGIGFGKSFQHNWALLKSPEKWLPEDLPYLIGVSRKRLWGELLDIPNPLDRVSASVAAAVESARLGATVVRVHDVCETRHALTVWRAYNE